MIELPRYLQLLWGRESAGRRGPKPGRTIQEIGAAAVAIADAQGLGAVSMKSVATALGLTTMSLYRYLDSKEELYAVMLDVAIGPPALRFGRAGWRRRLTQWVWAITQGRLRHPWSVEVPQHAPPLTPNVLSWTEAGLEALSSVPLTAPQRLSILLAVDGWAHHHVRQSLQMGLISAPPGRRDDSYDRQIAAVVDPVRFPQLVEAAPELADDDEDFFRAEFDAGLGLLLDGIEALIARQR